MAVLGPPLTSQGVPGLVEFRHDVLMLDREFERLSVRTDTGINRTGTIVRG
jgi:hypothetical protein